MTFNFKVLSLVCIISLISLSAIAENNAADTTLTKNENSLVKRVEKWYGENMNYATITMLMAIESSFVPLPSEIVIPPAAYIASKPNSKLNIFLVILFGTIGALIGASFNYFLAMKLGRPIIYKLADSKVGRFFFLNQAKIKETEDYFVKHGKISTFIGRLLPGVRHLISIPAGLAKMNYVSFAIFTLIGALIWNIILALLGYLAQGQSGLIDKYSHELSVAMIILMGLAIVYFIVRKILKKKK